MTSRSYPVGWTKAEDDMWLVGGVWGPKTGAILEWDQLKDTLTTTTHRERTKGGTELITSGGITTLDQLQTSKAYISVADHRNASWVVFVHDCRVKSHELGRLASRRQRTWITWLECIYMWCRSWWLDIQLQQLCYKYRDGLSLDRRVSVSCKNVAQTSVALLILL